MFREPPPHLATLFSAVCRRCGCWGRPDQIMLEFGGWCFSAAGPYTCCYLPDMLSVPSPPTTYAFWLQSALHLFSERGLPRPSDVKLYPLIWLHVVALPSYLLPPLLDCKLWESRGLSVWFISIPSIWPRYGPWGAVSRYYWMVEDLPMTAALIAPQVRESRFKP